MEFRYGVDRMTISDANALLDGKVKGVLSDEAVNRIEKGFEDLRRLAESNRPIYGINTGFGVLCREIIGKDKRSSLQVNLLRSHACGVGDTVEDDIVKLMLILKLHTLAYGYSGVSVGVVKRILWHLENGILPVVYKYGSVGASGDLIPLAHLFLPLIGEGKVRTERGIEASSEVLKRYGLEPLLLHPKEGLALINGTQFIGAYAVYGLRKMARLLDVSEIVAALSCEAYKASAKPFDSRLIGLKPYDGAVYTASRMRALLKDSQILSSHINCNRVQDPYSFRCIPQVHGAAREAFYHLKRVVEIEINSVTDNPVVIDGEAYSGGNFHAETIAMALDYASIAVSELANISDRRVFALLAGDGEEVPRMLVEDAGVNSGFMLTQYATASLVGRMKSLTHPASSDSIPTSLGQEDHVSMGSVSAERFNMVLDDLEWVLAVELLVASQAFQFRRPLRSSKPVEEVFAAVRELVPFVHHDEVLSEYIRRLKGLISDNGFLSRINAMINDDTGLKEKYVC